MVKAMCMKCKKQIEIREPKDVTMANRMVAVKGKCPICGTNIFRITGRK